MMRRPRSTRWWNSSFCSMLSTGSPLPLLDLQPDKTLSSCLESSSTGTLTLHCLSRFCAQPTATCGTSPPSWLSWHWLTRSWRTAAGWGWQVASQAGEGSSENWQANLSCASSRYFQDQRTHVYTDRPRILAGVLSPKTDGSPVLAVIPHIWMAPISWIYEAAYFLQQPSCFEWPCWERHSVDSEEQREALFQVVEDFRGRVKDTTKASLELC